MSLRKANRSQTKIKCALQGPSGAGKTYSSLMIAKGLTDAWQEIVVIDTEHGSADLYAHLGDYNVFSLNPPYSPERYQEALRACEQAGMKVIIIDSLSHEWEGEGGILTTHSNMAGNSFTNWAKLTPRHNAFVQAILASPCHIIGTIRTKQDYVLTEKNGKQVPEKVGLKGITRDGMDYEFTLVFDLDIKHQAVASKDRTGLFSNEPQFSITENTGHKILAWCLDGKNEEDILKEIKQSFDLENLREIYSTNPTFQERLKEHFTERRLEIQQHNINQKQHQNGTHSSIE